MTLLYTINDYLNPFNGPSELKGSIIENVNHQQQQRQKYHRNNDNLSTSYRCPDHIVYLPPTYEKSKSYPVLYHLHGAGESYSMMKKEVQWIGQQIENNHAEIIVVAPYDPTKFSMWVDGKSIDMASQIMNYLIPEIEQMYNVSKSFIQGFSMGGFGAATLGFKYPRKFQKIVLWDAALHNWDTLSTNRQFIAQNQFDNKIENFSNWSPYFAVKEAASAAGDYQKTKGILPSVLIFTGKHKQTTMYGDMYKKQLDELGVKCFHIKTKHHHSMKPFLQDHSKQAMEFLLLDNINHIQDNIN